MDARLRLVPRPVPRRTPHPVRSIRPERVATAPPEAPKPAEAPFDPTCRWAIPVNRLWPGRLGHHAHTALNGVRFERPFSAGRGPAAGG